MRHYSYAGPARGNSDPDSVHSVWVDSENDEDLKHDMMVIVWSGNGYSRRNSWISAVGDYIIDLEENR